MNDLELFFKEQEERMEVSEEDLEEYLARIFEEKQRRRKRTRDSNESEVILRSAMQVPKKAKYHAVLDLSSHEDILETSTQSVSPAQRPSNFAREARIEESLNMCQERFLANHVVQSDKEKRLNSRKRLSELLPDQGPSDDDCNGYNNETPFLEKKEMGAVLRIVDGAPIVHQGQQLGIINQKLDDDCPVSKGPVSDEAALSSYRYNITDDPTMSQIAPLNIMNSVLPSQIIKPLDAAVEISSKHQLGIRRDKVLKRPAIHESNPLNYDNVTNVTTPGSSSVQKQPLGQEKCMHPLHVRVKAERERLQEEKVKKDAAIRARKQEEALEKRMTPTEYAHKVQSKFTTLLAKTPKNKLFLKNLRIFYIGGDHDKVSKTTRNKMDFIRKKGGTVVPSYDPSVVTHVVTDAGKMFTMKAMQLKSLAEIPDYIPTLTWSWITTGNSGPLDYEFLHAAFASRIDADSSKASRKDSMKDAETSVQKSAQDWEFSRIEEFSTAVNIASSSKVTMDHLRKFSPPLSVEEAITSASKVQDNVMQDPLAEFYEQAKQDQEEFVIWSHYSGSEDEDDLQDNSDSVTPKPATKKRGFTCDSKVPVNDGPCINQDILDKLQELMELHESKPTEDDKWRVFSYGKAIRSLRNYPKRIKSYTQARAIKGVGDKTALKIMEIVHTGKLDRINHERTIDVEVTKIFKGIYGVGPNIAHQWYANGCRTLEDVIARKGGIEVTTAQEIGIRYYDDINSRMPRSEAGDIFNLIRPIALEIDPMLFIEIMGSYRRGKATCGDIDILITRPCDDGKTHAGVLRRILKELHLRNILTEDLALPDDLNSLEATYRGLCRRDPDSRRRRIDILTVPYIYRGAALLYYTGDDIFNRAIRYKAGQMGYSLNQRGLYTAVVRDPKDRKKKITKGHIIASETEEEIFKILNVPWQEPHERVRNI